MKFQTQVTRDRQGLLMVNNQKCKSCIFHKHQKVVTIQKFTEICAYLINGYSHTCHSTGLVCFGSREYQATIFHRLGMINEDSQEALNEMIMKVNGAKNWSGIINMDDPEHEHLGFTSDKFGRGSYLWQDGKDMWVSQIDSLYPGMGNLRKLFDAIEAMDFNIIVPTPSARMEQICLRRGMVKKSTTMELGELKVMTKP